MAWYLVKHKDKFTFNLHTAVKKSLNENCIFFEGLLQYVILVL
jgi:hypothetical protein